MFSLSFSSRSSSGWSSICLSFPSRPLASSPILPQRFPQGISQVAQAFPRARAVVVCSSLVVSVIARGRLSHGRSWPQYVSGARIPRGASLLPKPGNLRTAKYAYRPSLSGFEAGSTTGLRLFHVAGKPGPDQEPFFSSITRGRPHHAWSTGLSPGL